VIALAGTPASAQSTKLYLTAQLPFDESTRQPIREVVSVDPAAAFRFYVVLDAPSTETGFERLRVDAVNRAYSPDAPAANVSVRVSRVDGTTPVEVPVRIVTSTEGSDFCEVRLDVAQLPPWTFDRADRDCVLIGMTRSALLPVRNPAGLYELRVAYAPTSDRNGRVLYAPAVRFRVAGEPAPPMPLPPVRPPSSERPSNSPAEVVTAYYHAKNAGDVDEVTRLRSCASRASVTRAPPADEAARRTALDPVTRGGTMTRVEVLNVRHIGARAWVDVRLHYRNGLSQKYNAGVIQEDGEWKITPD
jgi:hypothetical protein